MAIKVRHLPYSDTNAFSKLVQDYLSGNDVLCPYYKYGIDHKGVAEAIHDRQQYPVDRKGLQEVLDRQYALIPRHEKLEANIRSLGSENCFTVCTAHQPNLMTGYLYFVYKILHAIKLAEDLSILHPDKQFVPVYYMGSEDNDLDELGTFKYEGRKFTWDAAGQTGAVGRMSTKSLKDLLEELYKLLGPPGTHYEQLKQLLNETYLNHSTIAEATQYLVNELFGQYGLVVLNPDEPELKRAFIPVMKDELLFQRSYGIVSEQMSSLSEHYKVQAHPRPINLFYLKDNLRERIEKNGNEWVAVNTSIRWDEAGLLRELTEYPERFSPNVILRGLYQETILPDVVFIGGGAEVAYWLQLKTVFDHYKVFYPSIHLRQSALWVDPRSKKTREQLKLDVPELFTPETDLIRQFILHNSKDNWQTDEEMGAIETAISALKQKAISLDPTLRASAEAVLVKIKHQVQVLEKKMFRAEKRKMQVQLEKITKLKQLLFPGNGLQERVDNFLPYYLEHGRGFFDILKDNMEPFRHEFMVVEEEN